MKNKKNLIKTEHMYKVLKDTHTNTQYKTNTIKNRLKVYHKVLYKNRMPHIYLLKHSSKVYFSLQKDFRADFSIKKREITI